MKNLFTAELRTRDNQTTLSFPRTRILPEWYSWHRFGGPDSCRIAVTCPEEMPLWEFFEQLRAPLIIRDPQKRPVWWGFLNTVELSLGKIQMRLSLDEMFNRVSVAYTDAPAGSAGSTNRATTAWVQDDTSVGLYGTKELILSLSKGVDTQAATLANLALAEKASPQPQLIIGSGGSPGVVLTGKGWWHTLGWQYYSDATDALQDSGTQLSNMLVTRQFVTSYEIDPVLSGVSTNRFRNGDNTVMSQVEELMATGTDPGEDYYAVVDINRNFKVLELPAPDNGPEFYLLRNGSVENLWNDAYEGQLCPVAKYCRIKGVIPPTLNISGFADPTFFLVESAEYDIKTGVYTPTPRNQSPAYDYATLLMEG